MLVSTFCFLSEETSLLLVIIYIYIYILFIRENNKKREGREGFTLLLRCTGTDMGMGVGKQCFLKNLGYDMSGICVLITY